MKERMYRCKEDDLMKMMMSRCFPYSLPRIACCSFSAAATTTTTTTTTRFSSSSSFFPPPASPPQPLFLRPLVHSTTSAHLQTFHGWAKSLALASEDWSQLLRELTWLLQDATSSNPHTSFLFNTTITPQEPAVPMRVALEELYCLWRERVDERRPLQYIVGCEHWRDMVLVVREGVLIPRPETEMLVDLAEEVVGRHGSGWWADLGTGSGAIAVGIGRILGEGGRVFATDLSSAAIEVAGINVERYGLKDKIEIRQGSWFEPLEDVNGKLAGLVSNPPYISSHHIPGLQTEVGRHEPHLALDGGDNGMDHLLHLCQGCCSALKPGGFFAFETNGDEHSNLITELLKMKWRDYFCDVKVVKDFAGIKRFVTGFRC